MTNSNLKVDTQRRYLVVVLRCTCFRARYRKQDAPWLGQPKPRFLSRVRVPKTLSAFDRLKESCPFRKSHPAQKRGPSPLSRSATIAKFV